MSLEDFRNVAQGAQAILVTMSLFVAGAWAVFRFCSLRSVQKARTELAGTQADVELSKAELRKLRQELEHRPHMRLELEPTLGDLGDSELYLRVRLKARNTGNRPEWVDTTKITIRAALVEGLSPGELKLSAPVDGALGSIDVKWLASLVWPGEEYVQDALIPLNRTGVYFVEARISLSPTSETTVRGEMGALGGPEGAGQVSFTASIFFDTRIATSR